MERGRDGWRGEAGDERSQVWRLCYWKHLAALYRRPQTLSWHHVEAGLATLRSVYGGMSGVPASMRRTMEREGDVAALELAVAAQAPPERVWDAIERLRGVEGRVRGRLAALEHCQAAFASLGVPAAAEVASMRAGLLAVDGAATDGQPGPRRFADLVRWVEGGWAARVAALSRGARRPWGMPRLWGDLPDPRDAVELQMAANRLGQRSPEGPAWDAALAAFREQVDRLAAPSLPAARREPLHAHAALIELVGAAVEAPGRGEVWDDLAELRSLPHLKPTTWALALFPLVHFPGLSVGAREALWAEMRAAFEPLAALCEQYDLHGERDILRSFRRFEPSLRRARLAGRSAAARLRRRLGLAASTARICARVEEACRRFAWPPREEEGR